MKKLLVLCFVLLSISCEEELNKLTIFDIRVNTEFLVPATTVVNTPVEFNTPSISTNATSEFGNNNTSTDLVESIILKSLVLTIESPENVDFNFLQEVRVFIKTDGVKEEELAFAENLENTDSRTLELESNGAELTDYITKDSYSLRITAITDEAITESIDIKVASVFEVDAEIAGL